MISYAPLHGSVGPHVDSYDVFLLQGKGKRHWQINCSPDQRRETLEGTELSIIRNFVSQQDWVLEPGDLLYLPPGVAHYGVAQGPCLTYSIGFRAPSYQDLIISLMDFLMESVSPEARYADPDIGTQDNPGEIGTDALRSIKARLHQYLTLDDDRIERWFGRYITEPKIQFLAEPCVEPITTADLLLHMDKGGNLDSNPGSRFAYRNRVNGETALFVDGEEIVVGPEAAFIVPILCQHRRLSAELLGPTLLHDAPVQNLLLTLVNAGYLIIYEDD
jgi:50S ribosomal protein L16 3-hydroxylase